MAKINRFEDLEIWQLARKQAKEIYILLGTEVYKREYKLKDQMKASAGSVMDNIAEGFDRDSRLELINFLSIAKGSCGELKSQLYRCYDSNLIEEQIFKTYYSEADLINSKIAGFIKYLNQTLIKGQKFKGRT